MSAQSNQPPAHGLMFHHFHDSRHYAGQGSISANELDLLITFLGRERILTAEEWMTRAGTSDLPAGGLCFTFDDSLRCQFDIAYPVLRRHGITGFWFVYTSPLMGEFERLEVYRKFRFTNFRSVREYYQAFFDACQDSPYGARIMTGLAQLDLKGFLKDFPFYTDDDKRFRFIRDELLGPEMYREIMDSMLADAGVSLPKFAADLWMDESAIRALKDDGHMIGLHSHTHPTRMAYLSVQKQAEEYRKNHDILTQILGQAPESMAHPCNSYTNETLAILRDLGIKLGFRSNMAPVTKWAALELPREDHANVMRKLSRPDPKRRS